MKIFLISILSCIYAINATGQNYQSRIAGILQEPDKITAVPEIIIHLLKNEDTLYVIKTDSIGKFSFEFKLDTVSIYTLRYKNGSWKKDVNFQKTTDKMNFTFELVCFYGCTLGNPDNGIYYDLNEIKQNNDENVLLINEMMDEYPELTLRIYQTINPKESKKIAAKRMKYFERSLENANCDMNRIEILDEIYILDDQSLLSDPRSRFDVKIISLGLNPAFEKL